MWLPACGHGCQIGFFEAKFQKYVFFIWLASQKSFGFFLAFLHAKIICAKITYHPFSKSSSFKKNVFFCQLHLAVILPPRVWARRRQLPTGKPAEHGGHVTRQGTVAPVCLGPPKCLDVIYNHTNLPCQVYFLYVITYCDEIVTSLAVFINHLLSTAMAILSNKWKASYDSNNTSRSKLEETFLWVQKAADGSEAAYCKLCHCHILPRI